MAAGDVVFARPAVDEVCALLAQDPVVVAFVDAQAVGGLAIVAVDQVGATLVGGFPNTLFFDRNGELVFTHQGVYEDQAALEADIRKYALGES